VQLQRVTLPSAYVAEHQSAAGTFGVVQLTVSFVSAWFGAGIVALFIIRRAEPRCQLERSKATHGIVPLLDASMILFQAIVQVAVRAMLHLAAEYPADCSRIGVVPVGDHLRRSMTNSFSGLNEEPLGRSRVSVLGKHRVDQIAVSVYRSVQIAPLAADAQIGFITIP
jgi:hypothetical protein